MFVVGLDVFVDGFVVIVIVVGFVAVVVVCCFYEPQLVAWKWE